MDSFQSQYFFLIIYFFLGFLFIKAKKIKNKSIALLIYIAPGLIITIIMFLLFEAMIEIFKI